MADIDDDLRKILEGAGKDITKIREALQGSSKALIKNTDTAKKQEAVVKELIKRNEKLRDHLKANNVLTEEQNEVIDDNIKVIKKHSDETKRASKGVFSFKKILVEIGKFFLKTAMAVAKTGVEFAKTSSNIKTFGDALDAGLDEIPGIGRIMSVFGKELDDQTMMFKGLAQSGATFGSSLTTMGNFAYESGLSLVNFQKLIQDNSTTLAKLFGSVNAGIPQITGLARELKRFTMEELSGFGITMEETTEFLTTFAEIERARGRAGQLTQATLLAGTKEYAKNLTTLSRLTGESVRELDKRNRQLAADGVFAAKMAQMDADQQQRVLAALKLLPDSAKQAAKEFIGLGVPIGDLGKGLSVFSGGKFEEALLGFTRRSGKFTEEELLRLDGVFKSIGTTGIQGGDAIASAALAGNDLAAQTLNVFSEMAGQQADMASFQQKSLEAQEGNTKKLVAVGDQLELVQAELQSVNINLIKGLVIDEGSIGGKAISAFVDGETDISKALADQLKSITNTVLGKGRKEDGIIDMNENDGFGPQAFNGTPGFQDFGSGTRATLHGSEMVLPERNVGELAKQLAMAINSMPTTDTTATTSPSASSTVSAPNNQNQVFTQLADSNERIANHLNTLITIGSMTEKNTKETKIAVANSTGSLV
tara:strand:- start:159 stop:2111 length:1953 start_codon:yes stop_codon:yes gene_type:complete